jgi:hypothetical protein
LFVDNYGVMSYNLMTEWEKHQCICWQLTSRKQAWPPNQVINDNFWYVSSSYIWTNWISISCLSRTGSFFCQWVYQQQHQYEWGVRTRWPMHCDNCLIYCASPSALFPYLWKGQYLTWWNLIIVAWFYKNVYLRDEIWTQLKPSQSFFCKFLVVHISPTRTGELNSHHQQSPVPWRHCCHHLSAMQPLARCLASWLHWTRALFVILGCYHLCNEGAYGWILDGKWVYSTVLRNFVIVPSLHSS